MAAYRLRSFSERESWNIRIECSSSGLYIMAGRPLRGLDYPCYGYTAWAGDREVIESAILNAALAGMVFTPPPRYQGLATLSLNALSAGAAPIQAQVEIEVTTGRFLVTSTADS